MNKREFAKKVGQMNWNDLIDDIDKLTVENMWRMYAHNVFGGYTIGRTQYAETKQAYFIGFAEAFKLMSDMSERLPEDDACKFLSRINREIGDFIDAALDRKFDGAPEGK